MDVIEVVSFALEGAVAGNWDNNILQQQKNCDLLIGFNEWK